MFSLEHNDRTALHHYESEDKSHKYFKQIDMRDHNTIVKKLGVRVQEIEQLISEIPILVQNNLSNP